MRKKILILVFLIFTITCLLGCIFGPPMIWIWPDWLPHTKRDPEIPICNLVMDVPPRWQDLWKPNYAKGPPPGSLRWGLENCYIVYEPITFQAFFEHTVFRFRNPTEAYFALKRIQKDPLFSIYIPMNV